MLQGVRLIWLWFQRECVATAAWSGLDRFGLIALGACCATAGAVVLSIARGYGAASVLAASGTLGFAIGLLALFIACPMGTADDAEERLRLQRARVLQARQLAVRVARERAEERRLQAEAARDAAIQKSRFEQPEGDEEQRPRERSGRSKAGANTRCWYCRVHMKRGSIQCAFCRMLAA